ncbi:MAG: putative baseplate assembly protein, partial [Chloroflexi bacterium]|nr:putative baseplate assembly protein [Chloroflexota bacterium]
MATQYRCTNQNRLRKLSQSTLNGIDFLEVADDQRLLQVHFVHDLPATLTPANVVITGGVRVKAATIGAAGSAGQQVVIDGDLRVVAVGTASKLLTVTVNLPGDFSTYTLRLITSPTNLQPPASFDLQLSEVDFSFKIDCPSDFDCAPTTDCPPEKLAEPEINYLAKDYASFRRLMLDRMSVVMPAWQERNAADLQVALVELLAYAGDQLSYFQDAVATEAYLGTAHKRTSVRRHARLLDYFMHDGCNARVWVCFEYTGGATTLTLDQGTQLFTRGALETPLIAPLDKTRVLREEQPTVFETLTPVTLQEARNELHFYTWEDANCCLPRGATRATVIKAPGLALTIGDVLVFEEVLSPTTGQRADADPAHRHVVRLTSVEQTEDRLPATPIELLEIAWGDADALPFPLCLSAVTDQDQAIGDVSVARANVVLADHGLRVTPPEGLAPVLDQGTYRPTLAAGPLTQQGQVVDPTTKALTPFDSTASASAALRWELRNVQPWITLQDNTGEQWTPQRDLLNSDRFAREFVVEVEQDGTASLRFGDGLLGQKPDAATTFQANYRVGNGSNGNVGATAIARIVHTDANITRIWNPLPAVGGVEPETMEQVRQFAPQAFRTQERTVTAADYREVTQRRPDVQKAAATLRWTGSWYTAFVTVDRKGGLPVDANFQQELRTYLNRYRLAGYDLEINGPIFVPLEIVLAICVKPGYFASDVKQRLRQVFSSGNLTGGQRGFFHPDNFTFGQPLYVSQLYETALQVAGVDSMEIQKLQRFGQTAQQA